MITFIESDKNTKYYKIIQRATPYKDGKNFPLDKVVIADSSINFNTTDPTQIGGFCISSYNYIFRWLVRGDTLCEVLIPDDSKIYKTESENGIYVANKIILTNPIQMNDELAMKLYKVSELPEVSYFKALAACSIKGYKNTALRVLNDKVNDNNIDIALNEFKAFCKRREEEYDKNVFETETVKMILDRLKDIYKLKYKN